MPTTDSQMVQKKNMCIYVHTLYTHAHTFIYICIQRKIESKCGKMLTIDGSKWSIKFIVLLFQNLSVINKRQGCEVLYDEKLQASNP